MIAAALGGAGSANLINDGLAEFGQGQFAEAFVTWREAAAGGQSLGALYVGVLYDSGLGVKQDYREAMVWYRRAADDGSAAGAFNVGVLYDAGLGVAKDPAKAASWYARAADAGFGRAEYNLALLYEAGIGVPRNLKRATALFRSAASHGVSAARMHLASLGQPFAGTVAPPDHEPLQAFQQAQGVLLNRGPVEAARATMLFRVAAERHNALAEYDLGYCYEHGLGVPRDPTLASQWYQRAAADTSNGALRSIAEAGVSGMQNENAQNAPSSN